jgi:two-component system chemotaxis sensor kinase CheA
MARKGQLFVDKPIVNLLLKSTDCQVRIMRHLDSRIKNILGKIPKEQIEPPFPIGPLMEEIRGAISGAKERPFALPGPGAVPVALAGEEQAEAAAGKAVVAAAIKVSTEKLDVLMELVGELVISHTLVIQDPVLQNGINSNILKNLTYMGKSTKSLQEQVLAVRMIPLRMMFQKMVRLVRDLADKINKKIQFEISGEETEIDKTVIDQLNDPLVHLLRNSVDHGVETPEERVAQGKPETGKIVLKAFNQGGNVVVEIMDDGKGLNREKIRSKATEKGLIKADKKLSDKEIFDLILLPGFSTAAKTTDISGRGVGMDVVSRNISKLNGKLEIQSEEGKGSKFTIRLPLTMAIIDGMIVRVGKERYIVPIVSIRESIKPSEKDITSVTKGEEVVNVRGGLVPLIRLNKLFSVQDSKTTPWEALVVIVEANGKQRGIMVDSLVGQQQVVIKNLGTQLQGIKGISGGAILGDGGVGLILDVEGIIESL